MVYYTDCFKAVILLWFITIVTVCPLSVSYGSQLFVSFVWSSLAVICWERIVLLAFLLRLIHLMLSLVFCVLSRLRMLNLIASHPDHWPRLQNQFGPDQIWLCTCKQHFSVPKIWSDLGLWSDKIWPGTKSGYVNAPCSSDQTKWEKSE